MSRPPYQAYPHHHPHHGRPYIVVHDHDVLCGRGVNIAQHPGNERFRSLVNTRQDESYCTNFTTSEKRALAEEIINHIRALDPPGRFLKRCGRSQSSRGLNGPWEELTPRECVKKTCQALRDCNRNDREGYAAQVAAPQDVKVSADERSRSGLSLKEYAAAAVAKANPSTLHPHHLNLNPPPLNQTYPTPTLSTNAYVSVRKRPNDANYSDSGERLSPSVEHAAEWLKKQRTDEPIPVTNSSVHATLHESAIHNIHSTPTPHVAPVPVSTTPVSHPYPPYGQLPHHHADPIPVSHRTSSPQLPSPTSYHHHHHHHQALADHGDTGAGPYSPVALLTPQEARNSTVNGGLDTPSPQDLDGTHFSDHHQPIHFDPHHHHHPPMDHFNHSNQSEDVLQSAAEAAAALIHHTDPGTSLSLLSGDEVPHGSLGLSDL